MARLIKSGGSVDYTPSSAVTAGDVVVQGPMIGVACNDIAADALGSLDVEGVFEFPKAAVAITAGAKVYWTGTEATTTVTSNTLVGNCVTAVASGDSVVNVRMNN